MIDVNLKEKSVAIELEYTGAVEDFVNLLMNNGYWIRQKVDYPRKKVTIEIKEAESRGK